MKRALQWTVAIGAIVGISAFLYLQSDGWKLIQTDRIYQELEHPAWSTRVIRSKALRPNLGSGDFQMLYLVDVRRVAIPLKEAISFYQQEGDRLGFKEFHVDPYAEAQRKFQWDWDQLRLQIPSGDDIAVLSQLFPASDGNIRRHEPTSPHHAQLKK